MATKQYTRAKQRKLLAHCQAMRDKLARILAEKEEQARLAANILKEAKKAKLVKVREKAKQAAHKRYLKAKKEREAQPSVSERIHQQAQEQGGAAPFPRKETLAEKLHNARYED